MTSTISIPVVALALYAFVGPQTNPPACKDWKACRELALEAAGRKDYETFHDLAWLTVNAGPKNDPALMTMLARAQSLSGRPTDALVMLNRLALMGVVTDAATSDDFARVRFLPGWAELESKLGGAPPTPSTLMTPAATPSASPAPAAPVPPATTPAATAAPSSKSAAKADLKPTKDAKVKEAAPPKETASNAATRSGKEPPSPLSFSSTGIATTGLAYDAVSGRFILADGRDRRLLVLGERSGHLASLAGIDAGLGEITAIEIDSREGDLWVVSASPASRGSTLHKLQLISGRVLFSMPSPPELGPSGFADVAVTPQHVFILDAEGRRIFRATKNGKALDVAARLAAPALASLAPVSDTIAYAAYDRGLLRVDLATKTLAVVESGQPAIDLSGLTWLRWHRGGLVAVQKEGEGSYRLVRIRFDDAGRTARSIDPIDRAVVPANQASATIVDNVLYCLARTEGNDELVVKKIVLK
jgi:hypothetical protein